MRTFEGTSFEMVPCIVSAIDDFVESGTPTPASVAESTRTPSFPLFAVGVAWAVLAAGDAAAVTVGRRLPRPRLPWNERKGWPGLLAFALAQGYRRRQEESLARW